MSLSLVEIDLINYIEEYWNRTGEMPSQRIIDKTWGPKHILEQLTKRPDFLQAMDNRGIIIDKTSHEATNCFTKEQLAAIQLVLDYADRRTINSKLRSLGITTAKWNGWMKNKFFKKYVQDVAGQNFQDSLHVAQAGLVKKMEDGDTNAIKFYLEITGRFNGETPNGQNLKVVLSRLVEVLQRRVQDKELLAAIGRDFELILAEGDTERTQISAEPVL